MTPLSQKKRISIDIVSDVVCPWCYIGKKRLDQAIQQLENEFEFELTFRPFQLDPSVPESGLEFKKHMMKKFGDESRLDEIYTRVETVGETLGIAFDFRQIPKAINTLPLHMLLQEASKTGEETILAAIFFQEYFEKGTDLTDISKLVEIMSRFAWEESKTRQILTDKTAENSIKEQIRHFQSLGISGVPYFIINQKYGISGAQQSETFVQAFRSLTPADFPETDAVVCAVDGDC